MSPKIPKGDHTFALTAEHLYDLPVFGPRFGEELFAWRDDYTNLPTGDESTNSEEVLRKGFGGYLLRRMDDPRNRVRAPWDIIDD
jgi:hypothetical protein